MFEVKLEGYDDLYFSFSDINDKKNEEFWIDYYNNNYNKDTIKQYYNDANKDKETLDKIIKSAKDTALGFIQLINISVYGSPFVENCKKPDDIIKGVGFIKNIPGDNYTKENILMSVGIFTTNIAAFYVMIGICTGYNYTGEKIRGLSSILFKNVALMIKNNNDNFFGIEKLSFITRPLEKMGALLRTNNLNDDKFDIDLDENRTDEDKVINNNLAIKWLKECKVMCDNGEEDKIDICKMEKCVGDICFLYHFVLDAFSPKWGYSGKRIETLIMGGRIAKYNMKKLQEFAKSLNIKYNGKKKSTLIRDIVKINPNELNMVQLKNYCKFFNIKGYSKYNSKTKLISFIKKSL